MIAYVILFCIYLFIRLIIFSNKIIFRLFSYVCIFLMGSFIFEFVTNINSTYAFFEKMNKLDNENIVMKIIVLEDSPYNTLKDLEEQKIGFLDDDNKIKIKELLKSITYMEVLDTDFSSLLEKLKDNELSALVISESFLSILDEIEDINIRIISSIEVNKDDTEEVFKEVDNKDSFILYISGIDSYGNINTLKGRSDVNILAVINTLTHEVLLVNTPRDYYVQLSGTTGLKDKLTHAGIYGIEKSMATLEDLYNVDIDYYLRVNFNTLIEFIDLIGGVDINSDITFTNGDVTINKGDNHLNGKEALVYARERKSYTTGDNHRGQNQQQIITAIIDKLSSSTTLISKYKSILDSLDGTFQTNVSSSLLTSLIKRELTSLHKWEVDSIQVTGKDSKNYTYSMGKKYLLYVMEPNLDSVNNASEKMQELLKKDKEF